MDIYQKILDELQLEETDLQRSVYTLLKNNPDGLTRHQLVQNLYGYMPIDINNDQQDRKIRKAIEKLRQRMFPILADSSKAGYRLDTSREAVRRMIDQLQAKRQKLTLLINKAAHFYDLPEYVEPVTFVQKELI